MREEVLRLLQQHFKQRFLPLPGTSYDTICGSCAARQSLTELPKGVDITLSTEKLKDFGGQDLDDHWSVSQHDVQLGDNWLTMRLTKKLRHSEDNEYTVDYSQRGKSFSNPFPPKQVDDIYHVYVDGLMSGVNPEQVFRVLWEAKSQRLQKDGYKECCDWIRANLKGKYVITILNLEEQNVYCERWLTDIAYDTEKVFVSPLFNNRGHNNEHDYLTLTVYKF